MKLSIMYSVTVKSVFVSFVFIQVCASVSLPDYITPCSRSDPQLDRCMVQRGNNALPEVLKGDPTFNIPNLVPLKVPQILIHSNNLQLEFQNCEVSGLEKSVITDMHIDFDKRKTNIEVEIPLLSVIATYNITGRILILPIVGNGAANVTIANGKYKYEFDYDLVDRKSGKQHVRFIKNNLEYKAKRIYLHLNNLFNGDKTLADSMNQFLDENWKDVTDELYPSLKEAVGAIVTSIARGLFSKVPLNDLFMP